MIRKAKRCGAHRSRWKRQSFHRLLVCSPKTPYLTKPLREREGHKSRRTHRRRTRGCFTWPWPLGCKLPDIHPPNSALSSHTPFRGSRVPHQPLVSVVARTVPNIDDATFTRLASDAEKNCPVSRVLNAEITLDAKLI